MMKIGGVSINFFKYIGLNAIRMILFNHTGTSLTVWEGFVLTLAMLLICTKELEE